MIVCTGKFSDILCRFEDNLQEVMDFLTEVINGLKVYTQG
jgi:hypothetical protein